MKIYIRKAFGLPLLIAGFVSVVSARISAQTFTTLHSFSAYSEGSGPGGMILSGNTIYGVATSGGNSGSGTVFRLNTDGTGFAILHTFTATSVNIIGGYHTNSEGVGPNGLLLADQTLFGTAASGGSAGAGTVFRVNTDGTGFAVIYSFTGGTDGGSPRSLILSGKTLYGASYQGGRWGNGTVFAVNTDGTGFGILHTFTATSGYAEFNGTNRDGAWPSGLILSSNTLYGTTAFGGSLGNGAVFRVNIDSTDFTNLHSFSAKFGVVLGLDTNSEGASPNARLVLAGNTLFGTAVYCGRYGQGTVFRMNTDGSGFATLHSFAPVPTPIVDLPINTNSDGIRPFGGLILSSDIVYGTASRGGTSASGTVFAVKSDGTGFRTLHDFTVKDGTGPSSDLILSSNILYGAAGGGGAGGSVGGGTVFGISFRPQLTITAPGTNVVLSWPTHVAGFDYTGYTLQSTTNLLSPAVWTTNLPSPVVVNGLNIVTNLISGTRKFYRLSQ